MRLEEIKNEYGDAVRIEWASYLLRPEPEARPMAKFTEYTKSWKNPGGMEPRATFNQWSGTNAPPSHSLPSAVAGKVAALQGPDAYRSFSDGVFRAYFTENRTISEREVLVEVAKESGLDVETFASNWDDQEEALTKAVLSDYVSAVQSEITGVPAVVVNRTWLIPGAVDVDDYRRVISEAQKLVEQGQGGLDDTGKDTAS